MLVIDDGFLLDFGPLVRVEERIRSPLVRRILLHRRLPALLCQPYPRLLVEPPIPVIPGGRELHSEPPVFHPVRPSPGAAWVRDTDRV